MRGYWDAVKTTENAFPWAVCLPPPPAPGARCCLLLANKSKCFLLTLPMFN